MKEKKTHQTVQDTTIFGSIKRTDDGQAELEVWMTRFLFDERTYTDAVVLQTSSGVALDFLLVLACVMVAL